MATNFEIAIDRLTAWAETAEMKARRLPDDDPKCEENRNMAANYREIIRLLTSK